MSHSPSIKSSDYPNGSRTSGASGTGPNPGTGQTTTIISSNQTSYKSSSLQAPAQVAQPSNAARTGTGSLLSNRSYVPRVSQGPQPQQQQQQQQQCQPARQFARNAPLNIEGLPSRVTRQVRCLPPQCMPPCMPNCVPPCQPYCPPPCPPQYCQPPYYPPPYCPPPYRNPCVPNPYNPYDPYCCPPPPQCYNPCGPPPPCYNPCGPPPPCYNPCGPPFNPCGPPPPFCGPSPPPCCNPCAPPCPPPCPPMPRPCVARKQGCFGGGGSTIVCLPRRMGPPCPPMGMENFGSGPSMGSRMGHPPEQQQQPTSFNNCNFYVKEPPKGFGFGPHPITNNAGPGPQLNTENGEFLLGNIVDCKNTSAGDDQICPPPYGYPSSNRTNVWENNGPQSGSGETSQRDNSKQFSNPDDRIPNGGSYRQSPPPPPKLAESYRPSVPDDCKQQPPSNASDKPSRRSEPEDDRLQLSRVGSHMSTKSTCSHKSICSRHQSQKLTTVNNTRTMGGGGAVRVPGVGQKSVSRIIVTTRTKKGGSVQPSSSHVAVTTKVRAAASYKNIVKDRGADQRSLPPELQENDQRNTYENEKRSSQHGADQQNSHGNDQPSSQREAEHSDQYQSYESDGLDCPTSTSQIQCLYETPRKVRNSIGCKRRGHRRRFPRAMCGRSAYPPNCGSVPKYRIPIPVRTMAGTPCCNTPTPTPTPPHRRPAADECCPPTPPRRRPAADECCPPTSPRRRPAANECCPPTPPRRRPAAGVCCPPPQQRELQCIMEPPKRFRHSRKRHSRCAPRSMGRRAHQYCGSPPRCSCNQIPEGSGPAPGPAPRLSAVPGPSYNPAPAPSPSPIPFAHESYHQPQYQSPHQPEPEHQQSENQELFRVESNQSLKFTVAKNSGRNASEASHASQQVGSTLKATKSKTSNNSSNKSNVKSSHDDKLSRNRSDTSVKSTTSNKSNIKSSHDDKLSRRGRGSDTSVNKSIKSVKSTTSNSSKKSNIKSTNDDKLSRRGSDTSVNKSIKSVKSTTSNTSNKSNIKFSHDDKLSRRGSDESIKSVKSATSNKSTSKPKHKCKKDDKLSRRGSDESVKSVKSTASVCSSVKSMNSIKYPSNAGKKWGDNGSIGSLGSLGSKNRRLSNSSAAKTKGIIKNSPSFGQIHDGGAKTETAKPLVDVTTITSSNTLVTTRTIPRTSAAQSGASTPNSEHPSSGARSERHSSGSGARALTSTSKVNVITNVHVVKRPPEVPRIPEPPPEIPKVPEPSPAPAVTAGCDCDATCCCEASQNRNPYRRVSEGQPTYNQDPGPSPSPKPCCCRPPAPPLPQCQPQECFPRCLPETPHRFRNPYRRRVVGAIRRPAMQVCSPSPAQCSYQSPSPIPPQLQRPAPGPAPPCCGCVSPPPPLPQYHGRIKRRKKRVPDSDYC